MTQSPAAPALSDWLLVGALGMIWGASFMSVSVALAGYGPLTVAAGRIALAALALMAVARLTGHRLPDPRTGAGARIWGFAIAMGLFSNALPFFLLAWGQQHVASGFAGITMAAVPLFVLGLAHVFVPGERLTPTRLAGFGLGLVGVWLLIGGEALLRAGSEVEDLARLACLGAAACYAVGSIVTRRAPPASLVTFSAAALLAAAAMILPVALTLEGPPALPAAGVLPTLALVYLGLGPTALATLILVRVIRSAGPGFLSQVNYHVPVWSVIFGVTLLGETLPPQFLAALGIILAGLALSRARAWRRRP
jgi:drug/metabolite transporter (DMT)-like permease